MNPSELTTTQLLALHAKLTDELRDRGITRSSNNVLNSHKFMLSDDIWNAEGVKEVTQQLQSVTS